MLKKQWIDRVASETGARPEDLHPLSRLLPGHTPWSDRAKGHLSQPATRSLWWACGGAVSRTSRASGVASECVARSASLPTTVSDDARAKVMGSVDDRLPAVDRHVSRGTLGQLSSPTALWIAMWIPRKMVLDTALDSGAGRRASTMNLLISAWSDL